MSEIGACAVKSKANFYTIMIVSFLGGMIVMLGVSSLLTIGQYWAGLTLSDLDDTEVSARGTVSFTWDIDGLNEFEIKLYIADIDGDDKDKLSKDDWEIIEHSQSYHQVILTMEDLGYDEEFMIILELEETDSGRILEDDFLVETFDPFWADIDGEYEDGEWIGINSHTQYVIPYNLSAMFMAMFGANVSDEALWDIEDDIAVKDYAYLDIWYDKDDDLYILYDWCFDLHDEVAFEGFMLFIDTDGDRQTLFNITEFNDELGDGLDFIVYDSLTEDDSVDLLGLKINSTVDYKIERGFGETLHSSKDHVFFEVKVDADELTYGSKHMDEDQYGVGGIGVMNVTGMIPIMFFMTPTITIPLAEATFYDCGYDANDLVWRP